MLVFRSSRSHSQMFFKKVFLKILQYSQENTCAGPYRLSFTEQLRWLLLDFRSSKCFYFSWTWYLLLTVALVFARNFLRARVKRQKQALKIFCKKASLRDFASFTGEHLCWSLFLIELQTCRPAALLKRGSNTDFFLRNLQNF